jgi:deoxycytidylate deaminase
MKNSFFKLAKRTSFKSPSKIKIGCVIVQKNRVISFGFNNMSKTCPGMNTWGSFIHSELSALLGLTAEETKGATAYIYRETANGDLAKSRPCPVCYNALKEAGIKKICYTTENGYEKEKLH